MLRALSIQNIAVARFVNIDFSDGFTVMTGETGAGKSILIDSLELIAGARASKDMVRSGEKVAVVRAVFEVEKVDLLPERFADMVDENGELEIMRRFTVDGRSSAKINGETVPTSSLREISDFLLGISGQSDSRALTENSVQLSLLDEYAENAETLTEYSALYREMLDNRAKLRHFRDSIKEKTMMSEILRYQIKEIEQARLSDDAECEKLERILARARAADKLSRHVNLVTRALSDAEKGSAPYLIDRAAASLRQMSDVMDNADEYANRLEEIKYELIGIAEDAAAVLDGDTEDPERTINAAESRLRQIDRLKNKYGETVADIKKFGCDAKTRLDDLESSDLVIDELERDYQKLSAKAKAVADVLTERRRSAAAELGERVCEYLSALDMPKVKFYVRISPAKGECDSFSPSGCDDVTFMLSANPGEPPSELGRVASGGEMSRAMLSLKCALAVRHPADTYIFDEIDSGVSGATSERMGRMLASLSKNAQVLCVTHSPQIASLADHHMFIRKNEIDGRAESSVEELDRDGRVRELSRIIGGVDITEAQRVAAEEMLAGNAKENK